MSPRRSLSPSVKGSFRQHPEIKKPQVDKTLLDHHAENCAKCARKFTFFNSKNLCNWCQRFFCAKCSKPTMKKIDREVQKRKICINCMKILEDFSKNMKDNIKILKVDKDFIKEHNSNTPQKQPQTQPDSNPDLLPDEPLGMQLKKLKQTQGLKAAQDLLAKKSTMTQKRFEAIQEEEKEFLRMSSYRKNSILSQSRSRAQSNANKQNRNDMKFEDEYKSTQQLDDLDDEDIFTFLSDIRKRVIKEFEINEEKWSDLLQEFLEKAIHTVKPSSFTFNDSIDITKYVKITLVEYKDTSKSKYLNGVVIKKSIANKRMAWDIKNPKILLLSNSLGFIQDEEDFMDLESEIKQEDHYIQIVLQKIDLVKPNLIFVKEDTSRKAIDALMAKNITIITNVKESVMLRIGRLTQTINCPSTNLIASDFILGKCQSFKMESLAKKSLNKMVEDVSTNIIQLDGCLPFLGCTIMLSGNDMNELKLVKHALKKMLRLSRQLILEHEYYQFFGLEPNQEGISRFLHKKHTERNFLIFKEVSYSKRKIGGQQNEEEEDDDPLGNNHVELKTEKEVQSKVKWVCQSPTMKSVHFYSEKHNDISLISFIRNLCLNAATKCKNGECQQYNMHHIWHYYHKGGYVELKLRFMKKVNTNNPEQHSLRLKNSVEKPVRIQCQCEQEDCRINIFPDTPITKQLQELSFYSFLEQFFYNGDNLRISQSTNRETESKVCNHPFHHSSKIIFLVDIMRIEFQYHPVQTYSLDLVCFKDLQGSLTHEQILNSFHRQKKEIALQMNSAFDFLQKAGNDLSKWLSNIETIELLNDLSFEQAKDIISEINIFLENLDFNMKEYRTRAEECLLGYKEKNEFQLYKVHKMITSRMSDYILILKTLYREVFDEFIMQIQKEPKKMSRKDQAIVLNSLYIQSQHFKKTRITIQNSSLLAENIVPPRVSLMEKPIMNKLTTFDDKTNKEVGRQTSLAPNLIEPKEDNKKQGDDELEALMSESDTTIQKTIEARDDESSIFSKNQSIFMKHFETKDDVNIKEIIEFEERLKKNEALCQFMKMSPAIPNGFDMNCAMVDDNDFLTIICETLLSNDHLTGLREQRYMGLDQKLEKFKHHFKNKDHPYKRQDPDIQEESIQAESKGTTIEFQLLKPDSDVLNKDVSQKEIEAELLRLDQFHYQIEFSNYKPSQTTMFIQKDRIKKAVKVDKTFVSNAKHIDDLEALMPCDLDKEFYNQLHDKIVQNIWHFKTNRAREMKKNIEDIALSKAISTDDKYAVYAYLHPKNKADIEIKVYFPTHFQALRKLYCGSYDIQNSQMFKSSFWTDNTGGKSKSDFYKSINEKFVLKVIGNNEMRMFCEFALSYFEYMCRSFNQKCPTSIGKILGAYKIKIKGADRKNNQYYVILMENLTCGIDPTKLSLLKYDLKGSMSRRYVLTQGKPQTTRLDTNFIEDQNSKPIVMNYCMNRLMQIAIHNDTSFLSRHEKIDYSFLVWIDHSTKLMRVGIIDYIQYFSLEKFLESKIKKHILTTGKNAPTILNPTSYKQRFQKAISNYFMGIFDDQPCESFESLVQKQLQFKAQLALQEKVMQEMLKNKLQSPSIEGFDFEDNQDEQKGRNGADLIVETEDVDSRQSMQGDLMNSQFSENLYNPSLKRHDGDTARYK